jgi:hypothetical protein
MRQQLWQVHASGAPPKPNKDLGWYKAKFAKLGLDLPTCLANTSLHSVLELDEVIPGPMASGPSGVPDPRQQPSGHGPRPGLGATSSVSAPPGVETHPPLGVVLPATAPTLGGLGSGDLGHRTHAGSPTGSSVSLGPFGGASFTSQDPFGMSGHQQTPSAGWPSPIAGGAPFGGPLPGAGHTGPTSAHGVLRLAGLKPRSPMGGPGTSHPPTLESLHALVAQVQARLPPLPASGFGGPATAWAAAPPPQPPPVTRVHGLAGLAPQGGGLLSWDNSSPVPPVATPMEISFQEEAQGLVGAPGFMPYRAYMEAVLPQLGMDALLVEEAPKGDPLDHISGLSTGRPPWGVALPLERVNQLKTAFDHPQTRRTLAKPTSLFKLPSQAFTGVFKAPTLDPYIAALGAQPSKTKAAPPSQVNAWAKQMGPLYEALMSVYRLAHHQSILTQALHKSLGPDATALTSASVAYLAMSERELMATAAASAAHCISLQRQMHLGVLTYQARARASLAAVPFRGACLFGEELQPAIQAEISLAQQLRQQDQLILEPVAKPRAPKRLAASRAQPRQTPAAPGPPPLKAARPQGAANKKRHNKKPPASKAKAKGAPV